MTMLRYAALTVAVLLIAAPARADMYPDASNATPAAIVNLGPGSATVYATNHGVVCDGTTNTRAALVAALAASAGKTLQLPAGTCVLDTNADVSLAPPANSRIAGIGEGTVLAFNNATGIRYAFIINQPNVTIANLKVTVTAPVAAPTVNLFSMRGGAENFLLDNIGIDGTVASNGAGGVTHSVFVIKPIGTAGNDVTGITVKGGFYRNCSRMWTRDSVPGNTAAIKQLHFLNSRYENFYRSIIATNSPFTPIEDVVVSGNRFSGLLAAGTGGGNDNFVSVGSSRRVRVLQNYIYGPGNGIHAEEAAADVVITGNNVTVTAAGNYGIRTLDNNIGGAGSVTPRNVVISNNIVIGPGKGVSTVYGIVFTNDASGAPPVNAGLIEGNIVEGFARGIFSTDELEAEGSIIRNNILHDNAIGLWARKPMLQSEGNLLYANDIDISSSNGGVWGVQAFLALPIVTSTGGKVGLSGWDLTLHDIVLPESAATTIGLAPLGAGMLRGDLTVSERHLDDVYAFGAARMDYDGTTLVTLDSRISHLGAVHITGMVKDASNNLAVRFNNDGPATSGGRLQARFRGLHVMN
jgi:hypothetical protein